jgi:FixJ family two-component response regulator
MLPGLEHLVRPVGTPRTSIWASCMSALRKVTVIDDDPTMLKAIERLLRVKGFEVETFASAEAFLAGTGKAGCLILDIHLGGMSGIELRRQLVASGVEPPTIFITAIDDETTRKEATKAGCIAYLRKPFLASLLMGAIDKATS